ncbi:patatin-like phospholipase family protein [Dyella sp.]|uniref:patatin-like phospholipase family protein n=1 Tax=Dyella sp. TaxID=1869338 RepID=UPI002ED45E06
MAQDASHGLSLKLALQGGGAHGAFTWGALDRLLDVPDIVFSAVSGTSSGAMNAAALAQGWYRDGPRGARVALREFWEGVARQGAMAHWLTAATQAWNDASWIRPPMVMPTFNPLRSMVEEFFDVQALRRSPITLYVAATRVRDAALVVFDGDRLSHDALLASACLPMLHPTVEIEGEGYWDGGFAGNPTLDPLLGLAGDRIVCVLVQPMSLGATPRRPRDILDVSMQQAFGAAFLREVRDLARAHRRAAQKLLPNAQERQLRRLDLQFIGPADTLGGQDARPQRLHELHAQGWAAADAWYARWMAGAQPAGTAGWAETFA